MTRVADIAQHARVLGFIDSSQSRVNELQTQIGSGYKSQEYMGISREAERLVSLEATHTRTTQYVKNNETVERRLQTMETNISQIFDVMTGYKTLLIDALNAQNSADLNMTVRAQEMLNQISSLLNVAEDGRFLFAGGKRVAEIKIVMSDGLRKEGGTISAQEIAQNEDKVFLPDEPLSL